ncbi:hypothetical protein T439DRAFT_356016 [Meredithblackwellia eburnea MCA 4105]
MSLVNVLNDEGGKLRSPFDSSSHPVQPPSSHQPSVSGVQHHPAQIQQQNHLQAHHNHHHQTRMEQQDDPWHERSQSHHAGMSTHAVLAYGHEANSNSTSPTSPYGGTLMTGDRRQLASAFSSEVWTEGGGYTSAQAVTLNGQVDSRNRSQQLQLQQQHHQNHNHPKFSPPPLPHHLNLSRDQTTQSASHQHLLGTRNVSFVQHRSIESLPAHSHEQNRHFSFTSHQGTTSEAYETYTTQPGLSSPIAIPRAQSSPSAWDCSVSAPSPTEGAWTYTPRSLESFQSMGISSSSSFPPQPTYSVNSRPPRPTVHPPRAVSYSPEQYSAIARVVDPSHHSQSLQPQSLFEDPQNSQFIHPHQPVKEELVNHGLGEENSRPECAWSGSPNSPHDHPHHIPPPPPPSASNPTSTSTENATPSSFRDHELVTRTPSPVTEKDSDYEDCSSSPRPARRTPGGGPIRGKKLASSKKAKGVAGTNNFNDDGSGRPISPITGLPTKILAKRLFPPRDAAKRRFHCEQEGCGKSFGRPSARETHMRSHNGVRPFECPIPTCARSFSVFSNLKRHMIVHPGVDFRGITVHDLPHLIWDPSEVPSLHFRHSTRSLPTPPGGGRGGGYAPASAPLSQNTSLPKSPIMERHRRTRSANSIKNYSERDGDSSDDDEDADAEQDLDYYDGEDEQYEHGC